MFNFTFVNPTKIVFGKDQITQLPKLISKDKKILITYGGGSIKQNGVYNDVIKALAGFDVIEFGGIEPNPHFETLMKAVQIVRENKIDFLLAVGGGSVIDGTKFIAAASLFEQDPWEMVATRAKITKAIPIGTVLTLPATGSEMNGNSVVTRVSTKQKRGFFSQLVYPQFSILDPTYTFSLPPRQTANGVIDAFVHTIEQYLTFPADNPLQDGMCEAVFRTLIAEGPKALQTPNDYNARANVMWSATIGLNGILGAGSPGDWSTHMLGHELTALFGIDHAVSLAIVLPSLMHIQREKKKEKIMQLGRNVFQLGSQNEDELVNKTIEAVREFFQSLGVKTKLSEYGISKPDISLLIANLEKNGMTRLGEHGDISPTVSSRIYELSL